MNVVQDYVAAWAEPDEDARRALVERCWAPDGTYQDPLGRAEGRDGLVQHIAGFLERFPGHRIDLASGVDTHDRWLRFAWVIRGPDSAAVLDGVDFGALDDAGLLRSIVGFFGPLPPA